MTVFESDDEDLTTYCHICDNDPCRCDEIYDRWHDAPYDEIQGEKS